MHIYYTKIGCVHRCTATAHACSADRFNMQTINGSVMHIKIWLEIISQNQMHRIDITNTMGWGQRGVGIFINMLRPPFRLLLHPLNKWTVEYKENMEGEPINKNRTWRGEKNLPSAHFPLCGSINTNFKFLIRKFFKANQTLTLSREVQAKQQTCLLFLRATKLATTSAERAYIGP